MAEPPICAGCGGRHWFLDPCGTREVVTAAAPGPLAATASADEIEKALRFYRAHKARARDRQRRKRAAPDHKG
jgi:hypothetical protein